MLKSKRIHDSDPDLKANGPAPTLPPVTPAVPEPAAVNVLAPVVPVRMPLPRSMLAYGIGPAPFVDVADDKRWLAYRILDGVCEVLTPVRHGRDFGESKASACARVSREMQLEFPRFGRPARTG